MCSWPHAAGAARTSASGSVIGRQMQLAALGSSGSDDEASERSGVLDWMLDSTESFL